MHGCSQPNDNFKIGAGWTPVADEFGMVVALPQASDEVSFGSRLRCWNFHTGMSNIESCLAPDIFAGVGVNAGPAPGSVGNDLSIPGISVNQGKSNCETLANRDGYNNQSHLYNQLWNTVHGTKDSLISSAHADRNADITVAVYSKGTAISPCETGTIAGAISGNHGDLTVWCDAKGPRVSKILVNGMGHAWPAGNNSSGGGKYIDHNHINYPMWITQWFFDNNRRVGVNTQTTAP